MWKLLEFLDYGVIELASEEDVWLCKLVTYSFNNVYLI